MQKNYLPLISVITPTYNRAGFLKETIESVLNQTYQNIEYIIVDDGSSDNTKEVVEPYLNDFRVKYFKHTNMGESKTTNRGYALSKGELTIVVNSDDPLFDNTYFEKSVTVFHERPEILAVYPNWVSTDINSNVISKIEVPQFDLLSLHLSANATLGPGMIIKRNILEKIGFRDENIKYTGDLSISFKLAEIGVIKHINCFGATHRNHSGCAQNNISQQKEIAQEILDLYLRILKKEKENIPECVWENRKSIFKNASYLYRCYAGCQPQFNKIFLQKLDLPYYEFNVLQISDYDLIGNKFNGHNLHNYLLEKDINAKQLVITKQSDDINTYQLNSYSNLLKNKLIYDADIIHLHLIHNTDFNLFMLPILCKLKPVVITLHDCFWAGGHCLHSFDCTKWLKHCYDCNYLDKPISIKKDNSALNFFSKKEIFQNSEITAIVASDFTMEKYSKSPIWKNKKIYKLPFGIDQNIFKPFDKKEAKRQLGIDEDSIVIMFRATSNVFKGFNIILDALKKLNVQEKITLIAVEQRNMLNGLKNKYKIKDFGWLNNDEKLAKLYQASDLFLMPSEQEDFGLMAIEAMSCNTPVLALQGTAVEKVVNAPENSFCTTKENFKEDLERILNNKKVLQEKGKKALEFAQSHYNLTNYINGMIDIYKNTILNHQITNESELVLSQMQKYAEYDNVNLKYISKLGNIFSIVKTIDRLIITILGVQIKYKVKK